MRALPRILKLFLIAAKINAKFSYPKISFYHSCHLKAGVPSGAPVIQAM